MIVQVVRASIKPEARDRWLEVIAENAKRTREENGCIRYQAAEDLEAPNNFVLVELWETMDAVHKHFQSQFEGMMATFGDILAAPPEAFIYEVAETHTLEEVLQAAGLGG